MLGTQGHHLDLSSEKFLRSMPSANISPGSLPKGWPWLMRALYSIKWLRRGSQASISLVKVLVNLLFFRLLYIWSIAFKLLHRHVDPVETHMGFGGREQ